MIYEKILQYCREKNISVKKLETETGLANGTIGKWKFSNPTVANAKLVADYLGITVDELIR